MQALVRVPSMGTFLWFTSFRAKTVIPVSIGGFIEGTYPAKAILRGPLRGRRGGPNP